MPTILGTTCSDTGGVATTTITVTLPAWTAGDLALVFLAADSTARTWSSTGWTEASADSDGTLPSGAIFYRVLESADSNPVFTISPTSRQQSAIAVVIDDGTFDATTPIDAAEAGTWNQGTSTTPQASAITTNTDGAHAFAICGIDAATSSGQAPYAVTGSWTETHSADCFPSGGFTTGVCVGDKAIATAGTTGVCDFTINSSDQWNCAIVAIKPAAAAGVSITVPLATYTVAGLVPTIETGVAVEVPLATYTVAGLVPTVVAAQGAAVEVPLATYTVAGLVPAVAAGASVEVPLATYTVAGLVPTIDVGGAVTVDVPLATYTVAGLVPAVAAGVAVAVPLATYTVAGLVPSVQAAAVTTVEVPVATYTVAGLVPTVAAGAAVAVPLATYTFTASIPMITAGITAFPSMTIETDDDRLGVMTHDNVTLVHSGVPYLAIAAETDGLTLDSGTDTDGMIEVQINTSAVAAGNIQEHETVSIGGVAYTIGKIDTIGGGMSVMYLIP